jgi:hypothetical protein
MSVVEENAGSEDDEPLSLLGGKGFASTIERLSGLAQRLVPILVPALVPALTDGIRDALPDIQGPRQKIPKNKSRGIKELRDARRKEKEDEDSEERRTILVSEQIDQKLVKLTRKTRIICENSSRIYSVLMRMMILSSTSR